ncbi:hypothetical protein IWZ00DRAFT_321280 [Phyllosticta capitalensis]
MPWYLIVCGHCLRAIWGLKCTVGAEMLARKVRRRVTISSRTVLVLIPQKLTDITIQCVPGPSYGPSCSSPALLRESVHCSGTIVSAFWHHAVRCVEASKHKTSSFWSSPSVEQHSAA